MLTRLLPLLNQYVILQLELYVYAFAGFPADSQWSK